MKNTIDSIRYKYLIYPLVFTSFYILPILNSGAQNFDVNGDNKVDFSDLEHIASRLNVIENQPASDINRDGKVNIFDLVEVASYLTPLSEEKK